jgi:hypothetical protein
MFCLCLTHSFYLYRWQQMSNSMTNLKIVFLGFVFILNNKLVFIVNMSRKNSKEREKKELLKIANKWVLNQSAFIEFQM